MPAHNGLQLGRAHTYACVTSMFIAVSLPCQADVLPSRAPRPLLPEACRAWYIHISYLINEHRKSDELDDVQLGEIIRQFYEAQSACTAERFTEGLAIYEAIPVGHVKGKPLR